MKSKKAQTTNMQVIEGKPVIIEEKIGNETVKREEKKKSKLWLWILIIVLLVVVGFSIYYFFFR